MQKHDIVYILKDGSDTEELRYSLRSLVNFPHGKVFIVGHKPKWASTKLIEIQRKDFDWNDGTLGYLDAEARWISACDDKRVSNEFWMFNDDFFIMKPFAEYRPRYRAGAFPLIASSYGYMMRRTRQFLELIMNIPMKNYSIHAPMLLEKEKRKALNLFLMWDMKRGNAYSMRNLYGNLYEIGGEAVEDGKHLKHTPDEWPLRDILSTDDHSFNEDFGQYIRSQFPQPSEFERAK